VEAARRQGIGTHLTLACLATAPTLPAVPSRQRPGPPLPGPRLHERRPPALWWRPPLGVMSATPGPGCRGVHNAWHGWVRPRITLPVTAGWRTTSWGCATG
jgi:hypothetical protein